MGYVKGCILRVTQQGQNGLDAAAYNETHTSGSIEQRADSDIYDCLISLAIFTTK